jgi:hypothetical protein
MYYPTNINDKSFEDAQKNSREMNKQKDDPCYIQLHSEENNKKLKFVTTNYIDLLEGNDKLNFFGVSVKDQLFVPSEKINTYSDLLNGSQGNIMTNPNIRYGFGPLPMPTLPSRYQLFHGDVDVEDSMRNFIEVKKNSCNPREINFHDRHFTIFDDTKGIETPNASKSVETVEFGPRGGASTRKFINKKL